MINWGDRLEREEPFFRKIFQDAGASRILDLACGTGQHAIMFSKWGLSVYAADASSEMVQLARKNSVEAGVKIEFTTAGLEEVDQFFTPGFDVITCMGNSLPHIRSKEGLTKAAGAVSRLLRDDGVFTLQIRNYRRIYEKNEQFMPVNHRVDTDKEYYYLRMTELEQEWITFNIIVLEKNHLGEGSYRVFSEKLKPWMFEDIDAALNKAGLKITGVYGNMKFDPFDPLESPDLVITAKKTAVLAGGL